MVRSLACTGTRTQNARRVVACPAGTGSDGDSFCLMGADAAGLWTRSLSAAGARIEAASSVGGKLQQPDTRSATKGGAGLIIDGVGRQMAGASGQASAPPQNLPAHGDT